MSLYRPNSAALLIRPDGKLLVCEREDQSGAWQFPQGGVDEGETSQEALMREIKEEVGVCEKHYDIVSQKGGYRYDYPSNSKKSKRYVGQEQTYFLCQLHDKDTKIDIDQKPREFDDYKWINPRDFHLKWLPKFKRDVYKQVMLDFFQVDL